MDIWIVLGIEATVDIAAIKKAYARKAAECHPEEAPKAFQVLHAAYLEALEFAEMQAKINPAKEEEPATIKPDDFRAPPKDLQRLNFNIPEGPGPEESSGCDAELQAEAGSSSFQFPGGEEADPPASPLINAEDRPGYVFSPPQATSHGLALEDEDDERPQAEENSGSYQFPMLGSQAGESLSMPGSFLYNADSAGGPLFMPLAEDAPQDASPLTPGAQERRRLYDSAHEDCLGAIKNLIDQQAPEQDWFPVLRGADFILIQYDEEFLWALLNLCRKQLTLGMASALYLAYGLASNKVLRKYPSAATLYNVLNQTLELPQADIPFQPLSEILHHSELVLKGLARLSSASHNSYVCSQALRTPAFVEVMYQPYFIFKLTDYLKNNIVADGWRKVLAQAYHFREIPASPCLKLLAEQLPAATEAPERMDYNPAAENLLLNDASLDEFRAAARSSILELMLKTKKSFPQSSRQTPWNYVFALPEFTFVRLESSFLTCLTALLKKEQWPAGLKPALTAAYDADFTGLSEDAAAAEDANSIAPNYQILKQLIELRQILMEPDILPPAKRSIWTKMK